MQHMAANGFQSNRLLSKKAGKQIDSRHAAGFTDGPEPVSYTHLIERAFESAAVEKAAENATADIPEALVEEELDRQQGFAQQVRQFYMARLDRQHLALTDTYGCQQNEADTELLRGMLVDMGFGFTDDPEKDALILLNTCAIREHAEQRVFGNVGALTHVKRRHPGLVVAMCGGMAQQPHVRDKVKKSFPCLLYTSRCV